MSAGVRSIGKLRDPERFDALAWAEAHLVPALDAAHDDVRVAVTPTLIVGHAERPATEALIDALAPLTPPLRVRIGGGVEYVTSPAAAAERACNAQGTDDAVVQSLAWPARNGRRYPTLTGDLYTENDYPISYLDPLNGVARVVYGLGDDVPARGDALRFSPRHPDLMPDFSQPEDVLRNAQTRFLALTETGDALSVTPHDLDAGRSDGTLQAVGGVVSIENQTVYPGVHRKGVPVVTCSMLLRGHPVRLAPLLADAVRHLRAPEVPGPPGDGAASHRLRFALELPAAGETGEPILRIEDVEPLSRRVSPARPPDERMLLFTRNVLGHGAFSDVRDIAYVPPERFDVHRSLEIAGEIRELNARLGEENARYVLIVAGRIGSSDRSLGVPLRWADISRAALQVEVALEGFNVEESRGSHFFRQLTQHDIGYLHVSLAQPGESIDWERLHAIEPRYEGTFVRHLRLEAPLPAIWVDGTAGAGWVALGG